MGIKMGGRFEDKVVLVTGGSSGIGRTSALLFSKEGAKVVVADKDTEGGENTVQKIRTSGGEALFVKTDVSKEVEVENLIEAVVEAYGCLDCAHNNAGIEGNMALTADYNELNWDSVINTNLKGVWLCMKHEIRQMLNQRGGAIVNMSSVAGLIGVQKLPAYVASKHGVVGLTKTAALEYASRGIRINAVCPGFVEGVMVERLTGGDAEIKSQFIARYPMGRMGTSEEVAEAVLWLCSDMASFITGYALAVDGGRVIG
jgi:NAD(P)-dependent dehydrogenase (short-subunit alcohol dehydrogenase family)